MNVTVRSELTGFLLVEYSYMTKKKEKIDFPVILLPFKYNMNNNPKIMV